MEEVIWQLFQETGDIKYYLLLKNMNQRSDEDDNKNTASRGNYTK